MLSGRVDPIGGGRQTGRWQVPMATGLRLPLNECTAPAAVWGRNLHISHLFPLSNTFSCRYVLPFPYRSALLSSSSSRLRPPVRLLISKRFTGVSVSISIIYKIFSNSIESSIVSFVNKNSALLPFYKLEKSNKCKKDY